MKDTFQLNNATADNLGIGLFKCRLSCKGKFMVVNSSLAVMLGYSCKMELKTRTFKELFVHHQDADEFFRLLDRDGKINFFETLFKHKTGKRLWVAITASKISGPNQRRYLEGVIENISAHKEIEEKLALEKDLIQGLLDNIPDAIYFKDRDSRIIKVNNFYVKGMGLPLDKILGKTDFDFFPADQAKKMLEDDQRVLNTGKPIVGKIERTLLPNGTWNQVITTKIPMYNKRGGIIGTMGVTRDMTAYAHLERDRLTMLKNAFDALGKTLEIRDPYTFSHNHKVANICERIAKEFEWDENRVLTMRLAGELHDLGKISIPLDILNKKEKLNAEEYKLIREHVTISYAIVKKINFPFSLADIIYQHHERLDGSGYPRGLKEDRILTESRILAISDVLDAMTSSRPYRGGLGLENALLELERGRGRLYDAELVAIVVKLINENNRTSFWLNT